MDGRSNSAGLGIIGLALFFAMFVLAGVVLWCLSQIPGVSLGG